MSNTYCGARSFSKTQLHPITQTCSTRASFFLPKDTNMTKRIFISAAIATASTLSAFNPATAASFNILPFGDSITAGTHDVEPYPGAYRIKLWEKLNEKFKDINFVGPRQNGPTKDFDRDHAGYGGLTINRLAGDKAVPRKDYPGFTSVANTLKTNNQTPNLVLLMAGTNDFYEGDKATTALGDLEKLLGKITGSFTDAKVLVSSIPPFNVSGTKFDGKPSSNKDREEAAKANAGQISSFNNGISGIAKGFKNVSFVNVGGSLSPNDLVSDGIHPTEAGYAKLGNQWFSAIESLIPNTYLKKDNSGGVVVKPGKGTDTGEDKGTGGVVKPGDNTNTGGNTGGGVKPGNNNGGVNTGGENPGGIPGNGSGTDIQSVPEPTSLVALLGFGALGAGATRRRKQMQQKTAS